MISNVNERTYQFRGLKADLDAKKFPFPAEYIGNGSTFLAMDTGKTYVYDAAGKKWNEFKISGGGGGGQTGSVVTESEINGNIKVDGAEMNVYTMPQAYVDYLDEVTYAKPTIGEFTLYTASGTPGTVYETGDSFTLTKFSHKENNVTNVLGKLTVAGVQSVDPSATSVTVDLDTPITVTATKTIQLSGVDTKGKSVSKSVTYTFNNYGYSKVTASATTPTTGNTKEAEVSSFMNNGKNFTYAKNDYIYLFIKENNKTVQTKVIGQWTAVDAEKLGAVTLTQANGKTGTYYGYRVGPMIGNGSAEYRVH